MTQTQNNHFVGFSTTNDFLQAIDHNKPVNLSVTKKFGERNTYGMSLDQTILTVSQASADEVLYFEQRVHRYQSIHGNPFSCDTKKVNRIAETVRELAIRWLEENGLKWRAAMLAMPSDYLTLDGVAEFLEYNKEEENYVYQK